LSLRLLWWEAPCPILKSLRSLLLVSPTKDKQRCFLEQLRKGAVRIFKKFEYVFEQWLKFLLVEWIAAL
jgi:hypothetical protein